MSPLVRGGIVLQHAARQTGAVAPRTYGGAAEQIESSVCRGAPVLFGRLWKRRELPVGHPMPEALSAQDCRQNQTSAQIKDRAWDHCLHDCTFPGWNQIANAGALRLPGRLPAKLSAGRLRDFENGNPPGFAAWNCIQPRWPVKALSSRPCLCCVRYRLLDGPIGN